MALSKVQLEEFSETITFESCMEYGLEKVKKPTSIDLVRGIIAGPNMKYKCIELDQSYYVLHVMQQNLISVCENTSRPLLFMEGHSQDKFDGLLTVTLKLKTQKSRQQTVLQGCICMTLDTVPVIGFAHAFYITGKVCLHFYKHVELFFLYLFTAQSNGIKLKLKCEL